LIAGVVLYREGHGSEAMPKQFSSLSLAAIATYKMNTGNFEPRRPVSIKPTSSLVRAVVLIVDESIRADYVSLEPGNRVTPELVQSRDQWIDFGPSVSAGNCSHISNALLRFMADRRDLIRSARTNPTIWDYAKAAGYRTVFIDAQAGFIKVFGKLQNYMTQLETLAIDRHYKLDSTIPSSALDDELARIVLEELKTGDRVLIYANKNGAHFPYQLDYPTSYRQEIEASGAKQMTSLLENYAKAVTWSTDRPMSHLMRTADLSDVALIYTSDHGQNLAPGRLTHCSSADSVAPEEGIVPLMVATGNTELRERFRRVATNHRGHGTHFAIAPTLLELVGYQQADVSAAYDGSLLTQLRWKPAFVSDDILGLFSKEATWHDADPSIEIVQDNPKSPNPASDAY
jgi:glucan phosphoethanolaminetransferase (alkaline phosphatase superfamily)